MTSVYPRGTAHACFARKVEDDAIQTVYSAIHSGNPTNDMTAIKDLEALQMMAQGQATKIFLPIEATAILGSLAGIGEILKEKVEPDKPKAS